MRRLFEDPEQSPELRDDLLRSRAAGQDYATADKLAQLRAALSDSARQPLGQGARFAALHPGWKLAALLALGGASVLLTQQASREPVREPQSPPAAAAPTEVAPAAAVIEPSLVPEVGQPAAATVDPAASNAPEKSSRREIAQLVRIRALLEQDPAAAYRLAVRGQREFRGGLLSEERQGLAIVALHKAGAREQAERKAREFFARFPQSPMRGMVEAELGQELR